jgi:septum formation protein
VDGAILGKPADAVEATAFLKRLAGRSHEVRTAVAVATEGPVLETLSVSTVRFRALADDEIRRYIASGEPFDKAGGYGIQGLAGAFVEHIEGSYTGIMGLPVFETAQLLAQLGVRVV